MDSPLSDTPLNSDKVLIPTAKKRNTAIPISPATVSGERSISPKAIAQRVDILMLNNL